MTSTRGVIILDDAYSIKVYDLNSRLREYREICYTLTIKSMVAGNNHLLIVTNNGKLDMINISTGNTIDVHYSGSNIIHKVFNGSKGYVVDIDGIIHYFEIKDNDNSVYFLAANTYKQFSTIFPMSPKIKKSNVDIMMRKSKGLSMLRLEDQNNRLIVTDEYHIILKKNKIIFNGDAIYKETENNTCGLLLSTIIDITVNKGGMMILDTFGNLYVYGSNSDGRLGTGTYDLSVNRLTKILIDNNSDTITHVKLESNFSILILSSSNEFKIYSSGKIRSKTRCNFEVVHVI